MQDPPLPVLSLWSARPDGRKGRFPDTLECLATVADSPLAALRQAAQQRPGHDVLVSRADAQWPADAWVRLGAAWHEAAHATVMSPLDSGLLPALPDADADTMDAACWAYGEHAAFPVDVLSGVGSVWRASAAAAFVAETAAVPACPDGAYVLPCLWVGPADEPAVDVAHLAVLALRDRLATLTAAGVPRVARDRPVVLHALHNWGGGIERFARDFARADDGRQHLLLIASAETHLPPYGQILSLYDDLDQPPLWQWQLAAPIADTESHSREVAGLLSQIIAEWGVSAVLVSSLIGHSLDLLRTGLPTAICTHDAYPFWPLLHRFPEGAADAVADAELSAAIESSQPPFLFPHRDPAHWRRLRDDFLQALIDSDSLVVAPSPSAQQRLQTLIPGLAGLRRRVIAHGAAPLMAAPDWQPDPQRPLRVLLPGHLSGGKGEWVLTALLPLLPENIELILLGCGNSAADRFAASGLEIHPRYRREELPAWIARLQPDIALLPSTVPETWSYTLSEMTALGIPCVCPTLGALADRVRADGFGWLVAPEADAFAACLRGLADDRAQIAQMRARPRPALRSLATMANDWREAFDFPARTPRLGPAHPGELARLGPLRSARRLQHAVHEREQRLQALHDQFEQQAAAILELRHEREAALAAHQQLQDERQTLLAEFEAIRGERDAALATNTHTRTQRDEALAALAIAESHCRDALAQAAAAQAQHDLALTRQSETEAQYLAARAQAEACEQDVAQLRQALALAAAASAESRHLAEQAQQQLQSLHEQLRDERTRLATLSQDLTRSYGFYERDTRDLARQRDIALQMRDALEVQLAVYRRSRSLRVTKPLRDIARVLRRAVATTQYRVRSVLAWTLRGVHSLRTRGLRQTWRRLQQWRAPAAIAEPLHLSLPDQQVPVDTEHLGLAANAQPRASIIVPVYNQLEVTLRCLESLAAAGDTTTFEVIVVDDCSSDDTPQVLPGLDGLRYHRNAQNLGFIGACNAGAELARGEFLVFLNNDTIVQPGWLDALLDTFVSHPDTGLAGSKLVYPDGRLQEAGGILFADGSGWNYGRFDDPSHPRFNFVREVDYCSGAAIALRRELFTAIGGFDAHYAPAYYEDADLAMQVRQRGLKVRYQPASIVVHLEGITSGTDLTQGVKAYQVSNQVKFLERWREVLARSHPPREWTADITRAAQHRCRGRVLVVDATTPTPDRDAGSLRMIELLGILVEDGLAVDFFAQNLSHDLPYAQALQQRGVQAWWHPWVAGVPKWLAEYGPAFDLIIVSRHYVLSPLLPLLREYAPQARIVFDTVDLHFLREQREAAHAGESAMRSNAELTRVAELRLVRQCDTTFVVSDTEKALLAELVPEARVDVVSTISRVVEDTPGFVPRADLAFVGGYRHPPNVDAARWLAEDIFPRLRARRPELRLHLVGGDAPDAVRALGELDGVVFHGHVPDLDALLDSMRVSVAPLRFGAGVKGKINQSLARGLPVVATSLAVEGMYLHDGIDVLVADDAEAIADAVLRLYDDAALWQQLRAAGFENTRRHFSRDAARTALQPLLSNLRPR